MKGLCVVVFIFFAIYFTGSDALKCYVCEYIEGYPKSQSGCKHADAALLQPCVKNPQANSTTSPMCTYLSTELGGKLIVKRGCYTVPSEYDRTCQSADTPNSSFPGIMTCFCTQDGCNGESYNGTSNNGKSDTGKSDTGKSDTGKSDKNGATSLQFTYLSLYAFAGHVLYKLM